LRFSLLGLWACTGTKSTSSGSDTGDPTLAAPLGSPPALSWEGVSTLGHLGHAVVAFEEIVVLSAPGTGNVLDDPAPAWVGLAAAPFLGGAARHSDYHEVISDPEGEDGETSFDHWFRLGHELLAPGDVTGDGSGDLLVFASPGDRSAGPTAYLVDSEQMWSRTLALPDAAVPSLEGALRGAPCGDVTGDGLTDLCLDIGIVPGPFGVGSAPTVTWSGLISTEAVRLAADDLDQDGTADLLVWDPSAATVRRLSTFPAGDHDLASLAVASYPAQGTECTALAVGGDLDGDGSRDLALAVDGQIFVMTELDADTPLASAHATLSLPADDLALADLDHDGAADLVVAGDSLVHVFYGPLPPGGLPDADHVWIVAEDSAEETWHESLDAADVDLDGDTDLLVGAPGDNFGVGRVWLILGPLP
jgi:hypothetical protein